MKCWNCHGLGVIHKLDEDNHEEDSMVFGDDCPICKDGKIPFKSWLRHRIVMVNISLNQKLAANIYPLWFKNVALQPLRNWIIILEHRLKQEK